MKLKLITTEDGSHSLYREDLNETYHSFHGAVQESIHVFIEQGIKTLDQKENITVFEVGFGTGLNALLTACWANSQKVSVNYHTVEAYPVTMEIINQLNYASLLDCERAEDWFKELHASDWEELHPLHPHFTYKKFMAKLQELKLNATFDIIYFDAFAPNKQAEMWELNIIQNMFNLLNTGGVLVTYCAKGQFKRDLATAGFDVETLPGPPGKKEMVRARKPGIK